MLFRYATISRISHPLDERDGLRNRRGIRKSRLNIGDNQDYGEHILFLFSDYLSTVSRRGLCFHIEADVFLQNRNRSLSN